MFQWATLRAVRCERRRHADCRHRRRAAEWSSWTFCEVRREKSDARAVSFGNLPVADETVKDCAVTYRSSKLSKFTQTVRDSSRRLLVQSPRILGSYALPQFGRGVFRKDGVDHALATPLEPSDLGHSGKNIDPPVEGVVRILHAGRLSVQAIIVGGSRSYLFQPGNGALKQA